MPILLLAAAGVAAIWRKPFAEAAIPAMSSGPMACRSPSRSASSSTVGARIDHVKLGAMRRSRPATSGWNTTCRANSPSVAVGKVSAHGRIEGGTVTLGDLEPLMRATAMTGPKTGDTTLPETISVDRLDFALETPMGGVAIGGSARLGQGALALDLTATDAGGHTKGAGEDRHLERARSSRP